MRQMNDDFNSEIAKPRRAIAESSERPHPPMRRPRR